jgi:hydrogenase expression/formation protein HypE
LPNEFAAASRFCLQVVETALPISDAVRGVCELLGLDPLYIANEDKLVALVPSEDAGCALAAMRSHSASGGHR